MEDIILDPERPKLCADDGGQGVRGEEEAAAKKRPTVRGYW